MRPGLDEDTKGPAQRRCLYIAFSRYQKRMMLYDATGTSTRVWDFAIAVNRELRLYSPLNMPAIQTSGGFADRMRKGLSGIGFILAFESPYHLNPSQTACEKRIQTDHLNAPLTLPTPMSPNLHSRLPPTGPILTSLIPPNPRNQPPLP